MDYMKVKRLDPDFIHKTINQGFIELQSFRNKQADELFNLCLMYNPKLVLPYVGLCLVNQYNNTYDDIPYIKNKVLSMDASWSDIGKKLQKFKNENNQMVLFHSDALRIIFR